MSRRMDRVSGQLREEISQLLSRQIKDPRLGAVISITRVQVSSDLRNARVFMSVMGDQETKEQALQGIQSAATFLRRELRDRINLRHTPFLSFVLDESLEDADRLLRLMDEIRSEQPDVGYPAMEEPAPAQRIAPAEVPYEGPLSFPGRGG